MRRSTTYRNLFLASLLTLGTVAAGSAWAGPGQRGLDREPPTWAETLERADADGDGQISADEFRGPDRMFERIDADANGFVTETEAAAARAEREARRAERPDRRTRKVQRAMLRAADADEDRAVSRVEWTTFLAAVDLDADGVLQESEVRTALDAQRDAEDEPREIAIEDLEEAFDRIDRNDDGVVSSDDRPERRRERRRGRG